MERVLRERDRLRPGRLDLFLTITVVAMVGITVLLLADPTLNFVVVDRTLDVAVNSLITLASAGLAALAVARYRESGRLSSLFQGSALFLLTVVGGMNVLLVLLKLDGRVGLTLGLPDQFPIYLVMVSRLLAAILFVFGAAAAVMRIQARPEGARRLLLGPPIVVGVVAVTLYPVRGLLPPLIDDAGIQALVQDPQLANPLPGVQPLLLAIIGLTCGMLLVAAIGFRFAVQRQAPVTEAFLSVGLVIAAFAELHFALFPGVYTGLVTSGDAIRLAFSLALLLGIDAEARADLRALRSAYAALDRMRVTETERAALEERARLAREIHDGLAQHLWFAKLKHDRLTPLVPDDARVLSAEVGQALDAAIVEARQALVTMRTSVDHDLPLSELIGRSVEDFGQRSGLRVEFTADPLPATIPATQAELLRVVQEALTNVRKHADATMVRVRASMDADELVVTVSDNGRGFDPEATSTEGLGLRGMEERARLMGGHLGISSEPSDGTSVSVRLPLSVPLSPATRTSL
ncbi:MAG: sensor histidine kinase [Chloroflexi bacterium]|nr:sensor histidine kinase [Chloroflexota bacterium]